MASSQPHVYLTFPTTFRLIPEPLPHALPPPVKERTLRAPFGIDKDLYNFALRPEIPITFATLYVLTVLVVNGYNRRRNNERWWISKQKWFGYFIIVHNILLALYSFATFLAMLRAIVLTLPSFDTEHWLPKTADALCKLHGPRGLGDAATFNTTINIWEAKNALIHMGYNGNPDPTDVGRLWNEGLAFWGWLFYVSKFYEVLDTLIILAKGKRSATLQTYHHAGAMLCMWSGIRYMSPPIWMFVFINSAIHAMMYTYFSLSALGFKVPTALKRTLTSLQIAQFVFGASYAAAHLFVAYDIPVEIPYQVTSVIEHAASSASSAAQAATKSATSAISAASSFVKSPSAAPTIGALVKKLLLRAAGEEGVAERVGMEQQVRDVVSNPLAMARHELPAVEQKVSSWFEKRFETRHRSEWTKVNCIDTSGEAFAIYLNLLYLAPLTFLFGRFFVRAYTQRGKRNSISQAARKASEAAKDASNQTEFETDKSGKRLEDEIQKRGSEAQEKGADRLEELRKDVKAMKEGTFNKNRRVSDRVRSYEDMKAAAEKGKETTNGKNGSRKDSPSKKAAASNESAIEEDEPSAAGAEDSATSKQTEASTAEPTEQTESSTAQPTDQTESSTAEPTEQQEANLDDSKATRPGDEEPETSETQTQKRTESGADSDAMGQSGSIVDLSSEIAQEATGQAQGNGEGDGDDDESTRWRPLGANGS